MTVTHVRLIYIFIDVYRLSLCTFAWLVHTHTSHLRSQCEHLLTLYPLLICLTYIGDSKGLSASVPRAAPCAADPFGGLSLGLGSRAGGRLFGGLAPVWGLALAGWGLAPLLRCLGSRAAVVALAAVLAVVLAGLGGRGGFGVWLSPCASPPCGGLCSRPSRSRPLSLPHLCALRNRDSLSCVARPVLVALWASAPWQPVWAVRILTVGVVVPCGLTPAASRSVGSALGCLPR